ncbi:DNA circularization N-terminal domain-containing protein [Asaia siamensis]|uniref:DNA circulation N-terminal domain-containing protein n=1 Tax=Asaia siamensis TaxID=110479 RepID=A0ABQ1M6Y0_9PROT|nr:DNA circularization N-terminal domain-containing protein [Asaia siamensis]GBR06426.1 bacteriophage protein [Asaia siamensis NRIC 0323]GGC34149.1 hypothetical protein GCM10007207_19600 [Asaia siamensis]
MSGTLTRLAAQYLQCSFRGIPFAVLGSGGQSGRNTAVHAYPWRDGVWVEDMGRQGRQYHITGLLVGPACYAQRDLLVRASEISGPGLLIHPSVGMFQASLMRFEWRERDGMMNVIDLSFEFIEKTDLLGTLVTTALHAAIGVAALALQSSCLSDYRATTSAAFARGGSVLARARASAYGWGDGATAAIQSPQIMSSALAALPGEYGRYNQGNAGATVASATTQTILTALTASRASIASASQALLAANSGDTLATGCFALTEDLRGAIYDPGVQITLLKGLSSYNVATIDSDAPIGGGMATVETATARVCRIAALFSLAQASADWSAASSDEAEAMRQGLADLIDAEATSAADAGWDGTWQSLNALRTQVTRDLGERAARLPDVITVERNAPMPALALAQQIYSDGSRASDLIRRANPIHPAFMPTSFEALSS